MSQQSLPADLVTLLERLNGVETLEIEVKRATGNLPESIWPTISAFANTAGGRIILGIHERDDRWDVEGVGNPGHVIQQLTDLCRNPQKIQPAPVGPHDLWTEEVYGRPLVVVRVPPMPRTSRPVYINGNVHVGTYVRRATGDYQCTRDEADRMMREAANTPADHVILEGFSWDDLDRRTFAGYRRRYQNHNPESIDNELTDAEFLAAIGGHRRDRQTGQNGMTVAGLLMFGKGEAIRSWQPRHLIDFRLTEGNPDELADNRWLDRETWEGNLLGAYDVIFPKLTAGLPIPFELVDGVRRGQSVRHEVLREALVNLLAHADYSERGASLIVRSEQGFRFRNPGDSRVLDFDPMAGDRSDPRNPSLIRMFRHIGFADEAGTGIGKIIRLWRSLGQQAPSFMLGSGRYEFALSLNNADLLSSIDRSWLGALGIEFSEPEQLALIAARDDSAVDNATLRRLTGMHPTDVTRVLGGLRDMDLLRLAGWGRSAHYVLDPRVADLHLAVEQRDSILKDGLPSAPFASTPTPLGGASTPFDHSSPPLRPTSSPSSSADASAELAPAHGPIRDGGLRDDPIWATLEHIAEPIAHSDYVEAGMRDRVILELCSVRPLSILELHWLLNRNKAYVRRKLSDLLKADRLRYLHPERPSHPYQRYMTRAGTAPPTPEGQQSLL